MAATVAWVLANWIGDHEAPLFAPVAVIVALSQPLGERGATAPKLVAGVFVGILVGEFIGAMGGGYWRFALATFVAMAIATALRAERLIVIQAGVNATLTVAIAAGDAGPDRLQDALIGGVVATVFGEVLFAPEPVRLVRRAEQAVLSRMGEALSMTAVALGTHDHAVAEQAMNSLRNLRDDLAELSRTREVGERVRRHSLLWWQQTTPVVREIENAGHLDLLGSSCVMLARTAMAAPESEHATLAANVGAIASVMSNLATDPGSRSARQLAVERLVDVARSLRDRPAGAPR